MNWLLKNEISTPEKTPPIVVKVASTTDCPVFSTALCIPSGVVPSSLTLSVIWIELSIPIPRCVQSLLLTAMMSCGITRSNYNIPGFNG